MSRKGGSGSVFDRLVDQKSYTGVYAERFKSGGGINGHADSGNVTSLAQITRPNLSGKGSTTHFGVGSKVHSYQSSGMEKDTPSSRVTRGVSSSSSSSTSPDSGRRARSTSPSKRGGGSIFDRLTDQSTYTGVYAERFKSGGGINGHADSGNVRDLSQITRPNLSGKGSTTHFGVGSKVHSYQTSGMEKDTPSSRGSGRSSSAAAGSAAARHRSTSPTKRTSGGGGGSIFDRLTDKSTYTGVYAERFRSGGGINGHASGGNVSDLSKITRAGW